MIRYGRLAIFDRFQVDKMLPKWKKILAAKENNGDGFIISTNGTVRVGFPMSDEGAEEEPISSPAYAKRWKEPLPWWQTWWKQFYSFIFRPKPVIAKPTSEDVKRVFEQVIGNAEQLQVLAKTNNKSGIDIGNLFLELSAYLTLIKQAQENGQVALTEKMIDQAKLVIYETMLAACGFNRFLTEPVLMEYLALPSLGTQDKPRYYEGFRLDWIANFTRILPADVVAKKKIADALMVFDNYAVLHYDPLKAASEKTKAEKRDPILFGLIEGSNKLYFVADWIDEFCDLTLREVVDTLKTNAGYEDRDFETQMNEYRKKLGEVGAELLKNFKDIEEIKQVALLWLDK